jgi:hypothetical protein
MYNKSQMQIARLLPILLFLIFSNVPLPLSGEFDEICAAQGPPVQRLSLRRSILTVRELQIAGLKRTAESAATDLRPRLANTFHVYPRDSPHSQNTRGGVQRRISFRRRLIDSSRFRKYHSQNFPKEKLWLRTSELYFFSCF